MVRTFRTKRGDAAWEEFEYTCTPAAEERIEIVERFENLGVHCHFQVVLPENWADMSASEKNRFLGQDKVDVAVDSVFFSSDADVGDTEIVLVRSFPELKILHIRAPKATCSCLAVLAELPRLDSLLVYGPQFGDEIGEYILPKTSLRSLDVQATAISQEMAKKIAETLGHDAELWLPSDGS